MTRSFCPSWVKVVWPLLLISCNDVSDPGVPAYVTVLELPGVEGPLPPLAGVEICETDTTNCVVTDANGEATLWLPSHQAVSFTVEKEGYLSYLEADMTDAAYLRPLFWMIRDDVTKPWWDALESPYPMMGTGAVGVGLNPAREGVSFRLLNATGKPFYNDRPDCSGCNNNPSLDLTETTSQGGGGFVEVPPLADEVEIEIRVGETGAQCTPLRAWPGKGANRIRLPVRAGYFTGSTVRCTILP